MGGTGGPGSSRTEAQQGLQGAGLLSGEGPLAPSATSRALGVEGAAQPATTQLAGTATGAASTPLPTSASDTPAATTTPAATSAAVTPVATTDPAARAAFALPGATNLGFPTADMPLGEVHHVPFGTPAATLSAPTVSAAPAPTVSAAAGSAADSAADSNARVSVRMPTVNTGTNWQGLGIQAPEGANLYAPWEGHLGQSIFNSYGEATQPAGATGVTGMPLTGGDAGLPAVGSTVTGTSTGPTMSKTLYDFNMKAYGNPYGPYGLNAPTHYDTGQGFWVDQFGNQHYPKTPGESGG